MLARRSVVDEQNSHHFLLLLSAAQPLFVINKKSQNMILI